MSHLAGKAKFKDGTIFHFEYDSKTGTCLNKLYATYEEMEQNWRSSKATEVPYITEDQEEVELSTEDYRMNPWKGLASKSFMVITKAKI